MKKTICMLVLLMSALATLALADGSDPMPLCRVPKNCPTVVQKTQDGPMPLCGPKTDPMAPDCPKISTTSPIERLMLSSEPGAKVRPHFNAGCWINVKNFGPTWFDPCPISPK